MRAQVRDEGLIGPSKSSDVSAHCVPPFPNLTDVIKSAFVCSRNHYMKNHFGLSDSSSRTRLLSATMLRCAGFMPRNRWQRGRITGTESANLLYYRSHIREACQNDHVMCLECGLTFKSLPQHLCKHHLTNEEYKAKWDYNRTTPLVAGTTWRGLTPCSGDEFSDV